MAKNALIFEERPWGSFEILHESKNPTTNQDLIIKRLIVKPGARLSYQTHQGRAEHWYSILGSGQAIVNDKIYPLHTGDSVNIAVGDKHRLDNSKSTEPLIIIEVITGNYDEHDIERLEDDYERSSDWKNQ